LTFDEKENMKEKKMKKRDAFESKNMGDYELIFPSTEEKTEDYQKFLIVAKQNFEDFNLGPAKKKSEPIIE
jgi:hypothetical protein